MYRGPLPGNVSQYANLTSKAHCTIVLTVQMQISNNLLAQIYHHFLNNFKGACCYYLIQASNIKSLERQHVVKLNIYRYLQI